MRIIAGKKKGLLLKAQVPEEVRPTSDKAREALFMLLMQGAWCDDLNHVSGSTWSRQTHFADFCAGVGTVGLEAWSRGADVVFVENNANALESLKKNIAKIGSSEQLRVLSRNAFALPLSSKNFDIVFIDAPYSDTPDYPQAIDHWIEKGWLGNGSRLVIQLDKGQAKKLLETLTQTRLSLLDQRTYGRNVLVSGIL